MTSKVPEGWKKEPLQVLIKDVGDGGTPSRSETSYFGGSIQWVVINDIVPHIVKTKDTLTEKGLNNCGAKLWPKGSIIVSTGATIGEVGIADVPLATKQGITGIVLDPNKLNNEFFRHQLELNKDLLIRFAQGTSFAEIRPPTLVKLEFLYPNDVKEQQKIATILQTIDKTVDQTKNLIEKHKKIKQGLMLDLFVKGLNINEPKLKDSPIGKIPRSWDCKPLGDICFITKLAGFEFTNYINYTDNGEIIAIRALNIKNEKLDLTDIQRITKRVSDMLPRSKVKKGDVLITYIGAYIGDLLLIEESNKFHLAPNVAKIVSKGSINPKLLEYIMRFNRTQRQFQNFTTTTANPSLTMGQIRNVYIAYPNNPNEQTKLIEKIDAINKRIISEEENLKKYIKIKSGLMQDLLTGKVRVAA